jgi:MATE family multidrug resistance protein
VTLAAKHKPHPFIARPNRTMLVLMFPVLLSLIAEPLTGLVDTGFIAQLGTDPLAGLGVATTALSSMFWIFNFLSIGTQTQISQAVGAGQAHKARQITSLALGVAWLLSFIVIAVFYPLAGTVADLLGASGGVREAAVTYIRVRLWGAPAVFTSLVAFGALRGDQDMGTPSMVAVAINVFNIGLDYPLIFGLGPVPAMGITGAALASTVAQWIGAIWLLIVIVRRFGFQATTSWREIGVLFSIGGNLFVRTGTLTLFLLISTRVANQIGSEAGAANQVIRQIFLFTALSLDAFAVTAQSLVGYFVGGGNVVQARRAAALSNSWSLGTGILLAVVMFLITDWVIELMVPVAAVAAFTPAWMISAMVQPLNGVAFSTDGIHMGTGDYAYLRNAMIVATVISSGLLLLIPVDSPRAFQWVWWSAVVWIVIRTAFGVGRIYVGNGPLSTDGRSS